MFLGKVRLISATVLACLSLLASPLVFGSDQKGAETAGKAEVKEVCHDKMKDGKPVKDKEGKVVQECKKIKVHKKLESHEVPPAKK